MYVKIHATICPVGIVTVNKVGTRESESVYFTIFSEKTTRIISIVQNEEGRSLSLTSKTTTVDQINRLKITIFMVLFRDFTHF